MAENRTEALLAYANEHYAHARDHEHLRSQVTAILSAGSIVLLSVAIDKFRTDSLLTIIASIMVVLLGALNLRLNILHSNRFRAHVNAAQKALKGVEGTSDKDTITIAACRSVFEEAKKGSLSSTWNLLPWLLMILGLCLAVYSLGQTNACHSSAQVENNHPSGVICETGAKADQTSQDCGG
ncbi:hypothetical protein J7399_15375 [Shimia sp. R9_1]|uniref:hypothetical protein n=1 Tax=Shimia sp. R9_1 TaxID=2821111 RepID=UPI001ADD40FC|nr:hypothetical protein [Shimia sp. R9_1]MBO9408816.1 hypothetical protein [Shimia sp. R9_1]